MKFGQINSKFNRNWKKFKKVVLLGITIDDLLTFNEHIDNAVVQQIINYMHYEE